MYVLLVGGVSTGEDYSSYLTQRGIPSCKIDGITMKALDTADFISLLRDHNLDGMILTSSFAAAILKDVFDKNPDILENWKTKIFYAVGARSADILGNLVNIKSGFLNAEQLASHLVGKKLNLLYPHSNLCSPERFKSPNITIQGCVLYQTCENPLFEEKFKGVVNERGFPVAYVFFSPSNLKFVFEIIQKYKVITNEKVAALGKTTENSLISFGFTNIRRCTEPNARSLGDLLQDWLKLE
ncbi:Uroporphyrinogen-III synthase [Thelohanellus kitauei]|uniref:Uroporphyrinogen-III synthase n=1 Tax=Thelohanellus kitauei TaxID=669202 RepID=A0A0C2I6V5_THEKT|nr:Uroporphyrinogen-III synthase [Thelohanellus kitauei]